MKRGANSKKYRRPKEWRNTFVLKIRAGWPMIVMHLTYLSLAGKDETT